MITIKQKDNNKHIVGQQKKKVAKASLLKKIKIKGIMVTPKQA